MSPKDDVAVTDITQYAYRLRAYMANLTPKPTSWHSNTPFYYPLDLNTSTHVFLRQGQVRASLEPPYIGPYKVIKRKPKFFTLDVRGKNVNVSVDRLKPAYILKEEKNLKPTPTATTPDAPATHERTTRSGRKVRFPQYYRP